MAVTNHDISKCLTELSQNFEYAFSVGLSNGKIIENNYWVIIPTEKYIEFSNTGPKTYNRIKWVDIDPITLKTIGNKIPPKIVDQTQEIIRELTKKGLSYSLNNQIIRLTFIQ